MAQRPWADLVGDRGAAAGFDILERQAAMQAGEGVEAETTTASPLTSSSSFEELHARMDEEAERIVSGMGPDPAFALMKDKLQADKLAWERQKRETEAWEGVPYELGHLLPAARRSGMMDDSIRVGRTGWRRFLGGRSETGGEAAGGGDFLLEPAPPRAPPRPTPVELQRAAVTRILGGGRRRTAGPAGGLEGRVRPARRHGKEPPAPEDAPFVTVGDVLEMCNIRLRRLPLAYAAREMSSGQALLDELQVRVDVALMPRLIITLMPRYICCTCPGFVLLCCRVSATMTFWYTCIVESDTPPSADSCGGIQAWTRRKTRQYTYGPDGSEAGPQHHIACVVSDDPHVLSGLPCSSLTGVDIVLVTSDT